MKIAFLVELNDPVKSGLYYAVTTKIKAFKKYNPMVDVQVFNVGVKQPFLIRKLFQLFKFRNYPLIKDLEGIPCENIYLMISLWEYLLLKWGKRINSAKQYQLLPFTVFKNVDLISAHYSGPMQAAYAIHKKTGVPFTVTFHGSDINKAPFKNSNSLKLYTEIFENIGASIFVSKALLKKATTIKSQKNAHVLYNSVDRNVFKKLPLTAVEQLRKQLSIKTQKVIGFVGNFVPVKNVLLLPEIFSTIQSKFPDVSFLILGDGIQKEALKNLLQQEHINMNYFGRVDRSEIVKYYSLMDVLVLPSKSEGLPMVLLEAMACGVQCVASNVGGIAELIGEENCVKPSADFIERFTEKVVSHLNNQSLPKFDEQLFGLEQTAIKEGNIYKDVLSSKENKF